MAGRYRVLGPLGRGSRGRVLEVEDLSSGGGRLALKVMEGGAPDVEAARREFLLLSELVHPHLTRVLDFGTLPDGRPWLAGELAEGPDLLGARLAPGPLRRVVAQVASALDALHARGYVHRDVKPAHVRVSGRPRAPVARLIDLDLAVREASARRSPASGTPLYVAPEVLLGEPVDRRSDVYSLGATLFHAVAGRPPFPGLHLAGLLRAHLDSRPPRLRDLVSGVAPDLDAAVARALAKEPSERQASAGDLARGLGQRPGEAGAGALLSPALVGREEALARVRSAVDEAARARPRVLWATGPSGSGRTRFLEEAVRRTRWEGGRAALAACGRGPVDWGEVLARLGPDAALSRAAPAAVAGALASARAPALLAVDEASRAGADDRETVEALRRVLGHRTGPGPALLLSGAPGEGEGADILELGPLPAVEAARLAGSMVDGRPAPEGFAAWLREATGGLPGPLEARVRALGEAGAVAAGPGAARWDLEAARGLAVPQGPRESLAARYRSAGTVALGLARALALAGGEAPSGVAARAAGLEGLEAARAFRALAREGLILRGAGGVETLASRDAVEALPAGLGRREASRLARALLEAWGGAPAAVRLRLLEAARDREGAVRAAEEAARVAEGAHRPLEALACYEAALRARPYREALREGAIHAAEMAGRFEAARRHLEALGRSRGLAPRRRAVLAFRGAALDLYSGRPDRALEALRRLLRHGGRRLDPVTRADARLHLADALRSRGRPAAAVAVARRAVAGADLVADANLAAAARVSLGTALLDAGRPAEARAAFEAALRGLGEAGNAAVHCRALNGLGLARWRLDEPGPARGAFEEALARAEASRLQQPRAVSLLWLGNLDRGSGDGPAAAARQALALEGFAALGDERRAAMAAGNLGRARLLAGELGAALEAFALCREEVDPDRHRWARLGSAEALTLAGDLEGAREVVDGLGEPTGELEGETALARGRLALASGDGGRAVEALGRASRLGGPRGAEAAVELALALGRSGDTSGARRVLAEAPRTVTDRVLDARRVLASWYAVSPGTGPAELDRAHRELEALGAWPAVVEARWALAAARSREGDAGGERAWRARALDALDRIERGLPEALRAGFRARSPLAALARPLETPRALAAAPPGVLERVLSINRGLLEEPATEALLDRVLDAAIDLSGAERGFLVLADGREAERLAAGRAAGRRALGRAARRLSRTIARRVLRSGEPVLVEDASADARLGASASVRDLGLVSILCLPLRERGSVTGAIYLDHRGRPAAFGPAEQSAVAALADPAALALALARDRAELVRSREALEAAHRRLRQVAESRRLRAARAERGLKALAREEPPEGLVGASVAMREVYRLVRLAAGSPLPALVLGESGTGKERVARALHDLGPRRPRPFVPVNSAALSEALLESQLFGHARGAFTGADRAHPGLLAEAEGGTLFLDEVAETSPGCQARLLRFLQDGEFRPLGATRARRADVRVVAATHRDLEAEVGRGRFREDLYYRLRVICLRVPPLRERMEDLPALAAHFLAAAAQGQAKELDPEALDRLLSHPWPGNVRELENEMQRVSLLSGPVVRPSDLSPELSRATPRARLGDSRRAWEREALRSALEAAGGNKSEAARRLGYSRFGLRKKLRRVGLV